MKNLDNARQTEEQQRKKRKRGFGDPDAAGHDEVQAPSKIKTEDLPKVLGEPFTSIRPRLSDEEPDSMEK